MSFVLKTYEITLKQGILPIHIMRIGFKCKWLEIFGFLNCICTLLFFKI